jgi:hypothetical protein
MIEIFLKFVPAVSIVLSAWCLWQGFRHVGQVIWKFLVIVLVIFAILCILFFYFSILDGIMAVFDVLFTALAIFISGIFLIVFLPGRRKFFATIMLIVLPLVLIMSMVFGGIYSPTTQIGYHAFLVMGAIDDFYYDNGSYPKELRDLVPNYRLELTDPSPNWSWLYKSKGDEYSLGYVYYIDKLGYVISIFRPSLRGWEVSFKSTDTFELEPTLMP